MKQNKQYEDFYKQVLDIQYGKPGKPGKPGKSGSGGISGRSGSPFDSREAINTYVKELTQQKEDYIRDMIKKRGYSTNSTTYTPHKPNNINSKDYIDDEKRMMSDKEFFDYHDKLFADF